MTDATIPAAVRPSPRAVAAVVVGATFSLLPAVPAFRLARAAAAIPVLALAPPVRLASPPAGAPPLRDARALAARVDGSLAVADWAEEHVLAYWNGQPVPEWLPPRGRFEVQFGADGSLVLLDASRGLLHLFDQDGRFQHRTSTPLAAAPALCALPGGGFVVANGRGLARFSAGLDAVPFDGAPPLAGVRGIAASADRLWAATSAGVLWTLSPEGRVLGQTRLVGNAGRLAASPDGGVAMADEKTGRIWAFDRDGRLLGRLGPAFPRRIAGICFTSGGALGAAGEDGVSLAPRESK